MRVLFLFPEAFFVSSALPGKEFVDSVPADSMDITTFNEKCFRTFNEKLFQK